MRSVLTVILLLICLVDRLPAQFSPGLLSKYHAELEGNDNCDKCHVVRRKELSGGCVECHQPLQQRIAAGLGYHKDKTSACGDCHSDHNGRDFELVYWPRDINRFDHNETGYTLTGKHAALKCAQCHTNRFIVDQAVIAWAGENTVFPVLDRTFLGLSPDCLTCHEDIHRGQVAKDCATCHNTSDWKLAQKEYDHNRARFLLTGAHQRVDCVKCHPASELQTPRVWQLTGMAFDRCGRCHEDIHKSAYGATCETCHTTGNWKKELQPFDHSRTKYPLLGRHGQLTCNQCHTVQLSGSQPRYTTCLDCHEDRHFRQFAGRNDRGDCAACHTVNGFRPAMYGPTEHNRSRFVLDGAHRAVPCNLCHQPFQPQPDTATVRYTWPTLACETCHEDRHRGQFRARYANRCESCHNSASFKVLDFDHQKTNFPLDGKHRNVPCNQCHLDPGPAAVVPVQYSPLPHRCVDCHTLTEQIR
ncbi:MAG: hypothetical protein ABIA75_00235 [Candidatus Neomarinimicrobiota bacterium]